MVRYGENDGWRSESVSSSNGIITGSEVLAGEEDGGVDSVRRFCWYDE